MSAYFIINKDIFLGLNTSDSHLTHLTAIVSGPVKSTAVGTQTTFNPRVVHKGVNNSVIQIPAIALTGAYSLLISQSDSESNFSELFQLNIFDPRAVRLQPCSQITCGVNEKLCWVVDCSNAGPGFVTCQINGDYVGVAVEQSPQEDRHVVSFTPSSEGLYILEVMYNSYNTGNTLSIHVNW